MKKVLELNAIRKNWQGVDLKIALIFPNQYAIALANLAFQELYALFNSFPRIACERFVFSPNSQIPLSLESNQPLKKFDLCGVTLQFELDILNFLEMLQRSEIAIEIEKRSEKDPLICAGGPCSSNPLPFSRVFDFFVMGDLEPITEDLLECFAESSEKSTILENISQLPGVFSHHRVNEPVLTNKTKSLDSCFHPTSQIIPDLPLGHRSMPVFGKSLLIEVSRGCPHECHFCMIGYQANPHRKRSFSKLKNLIRTGLEESQVDNVVFIGAALSDHPALRNLCWMVLDEGKTFTLPSLRADRITTDLAEALKQCQRTVTLAPETGSDALLNGINKGFRREDIINAIEILKKQGIPSVKLYFLHGLPGETEEDLKASCSLVHKIREIGYDSRNLKVSLNPWIPKAHTPLQWATPPVLGELRLKSKFIKKGMKPINIEQLDPRWARIQRIISVGDERLHPVLLEVLQRGLGLGAWRASLQN
ncbi:MAG: B12-binding domain-containing radical SAM protein [Candidatus Helarchaeota archaeon]